MNENRTKEHMAEIGKNTRFSKENAREAQAASAKARRANQILLDAFTRELGLKARNSRLTKGEKIIKDIVDNAADGDVQKQKLALTYALSNEPKETQITSDEQGIKIITSGETAGLIETLCKNGE